MKLLPVILLAIAIATATASAAVSWPLPQKEAYLKRRFIELELWLNGEGRGDLGRMVRAQSRDLTGCRALHDGVGGVTALIHCVKFMERERQLGIFSPGRAELTEDLNHLCRVLLTREKALDAIIDSGVFAGGERTWMPCVEKAWEQLYLAAYAGFDTDPVRVVALVRRARKALPQEGPWKKKVLTYVGTSSLAGSGKIGL